MMSQKQQKSFNVDGLKIDKNTFLQALAQADTERKRHQALKNSFQLVQLLKQNQQKPGSQQQRIKEIVTNNLILQLPQEKKDISLNPQTKYVMTKAGGFGKIEKTCKIVDKGLLQFEENKEAKVKQIKDFINRLQVVNGNKNEKLEWHSKGSALPYRLIVIDSNKHQKAIYFKTKEQAEVVRLYYCNKYIFKGDAQALMKQVQSRHYKSTLISDITKKMLARNRQVLKNRIKELQSVAYRTSNNPKPTEVNQQPPPVQVKKNENVVQRLSTPQSQKGYDSNFLSQLLSSDQEKFRYSSKSQMPALNKNINFGAFLKLQQQYKQQFIRTWKQQAMAFSIEKGMFKKKKSVEEASIKSSRVEKDTKTVLSMRKLGYIRFTNIQFLNLKNATTKPIVNIIISRKGNIEHEFIYETLLKSKEPHLQYELLLKSGESSFNLRGQLSEYEMDIQVVDYLSNIQILTDKIILKTKAFSRFTNITNNNKNMRIQINYENGQWVQEEEQQHKGNQTSILQLQPLSYETIMKIRNYWEHQNKKKGIFNKNEDIKVITILEESADVPKSWSLGLNQQEYKLVGLVQKASRIIGFRVTQSILPILRALKKIYSQIQQLIDAVISIFINYVPYYYFTQHFNTFNKYHKVLGLQGQVDFASKVQLQLSVINKILEIECPQLNTKLKRRNMECGHLLYEYIYELFSKNFPIQTLIQLWNFCFRNAQLIQMYFSLLAVWLCKFYNNKLIKCKRLKEVSAILQSHHTCAPQQIIKEVVILRQKYFNTNKSKNSSIQSIKDIITTKPLQSVLINFYKKETEKIDIRKENREIEKSAVLRKLQKQILLQIPTYPNKNYCLHIYFYKFPPVAGSLYIKTNSIQYECLKYQKKRYFIIGNVNREIRIQFINNKSNEFGCKLQCIEGVNRYSVDLVSPKDNQVYRVQYLCGLLTEQQMERLKKNRKFQNFLGPYIKKQHIYKSLQREVGASQFLEGAAKNTQLDRDDLASKIKVLFSNGSKCFNQMQFYLRWIAQSSLSLPEKVHLVRELSRNICEENYLSNSKCIQKILYNTFITYINYPISASQFECYYSDSLECELDAPKILRCRYTYPSGKYITLQHAIYKYMCDKSAEFLYGDILVQQLIQVIKPYIDSQKQLQGTLSVLYSSNGQLHYKEYPVHRKKHNKQIYINEDKLEQVNRNGIQKIQPSILNNQILPTYAKTSSILDLVHGNSPIKSKSKIMQSNSHLTSVNVNVDPQNINLLKNCDMKMNKVLFLRYRDYPQNVRIPFLNYFHQLTFNVRIPNIPSAIYINNTRTDLRTVCTIQTPLNFSDNKRIDEYTAFNREIGVYGNFRNLHHKIDSLYFQSVTEDPYQHKQLNNGLVFMNYGLGIYRWQPCVVKAYRLKIKDNSNSQSPIKMQKSLKNIKKEYLVFYKGSEIYVRQYQVRIRPQIEQSLQEEDNVSKTKLRKSEQVRRSQFK